MIKETRPIWSNVFRRVLLLKEYFGQTILLTISVAEASLEDTFLRIANHLTKLRLREDDEYTI